MCIQSKAGLTPSKSISSMTDKGFKDGKGTTSEKTSQAESQL